MHKIFNDNMQVEETREDGGAESMNRGDEPRFEKYEAKGEWKELGVTRTSRISTR